MAKRKVEQGSILLPSPPDHQAVIYDAKATPAVNEEVEEEDIEKLLEPLSRHHLISLLRAAAASDPGTLAEIRRVADLEPSLRELFVHGLAWDTSADGLRAAFAQYGEIADCRVVVDRATSRSKGYGFVLFRHRRSALRALRCPEKLIDNRIISCQLASAGSPPATAGHHHHQNPNPAPAAQQDNLPRKIYVGNVHAGIDGGRLLAFFSQYGEIEEGPIGLDRQTGKPKGYALFVYKTVEGARSALEEPNKNFEGHLLFCQKPTKNKFKRVAMVPVAIPSAAAAAAVGVFNGFGNGGPPPDTGLSQLAPTVSGQGLLGMGGPQAPGQGLQRNAAALALLAAIGQNPAAFGITPAVLASLNPSLAATLGAAGSQQAIPSTAAPQVAPLQGYGVGNVEYQSVGIQGPPVYQDSPGFYEPPCMEYTQLVAQQGVGGGGAHQGYQWGWHQYQDHQPGPWVDMV